MDGSFDFWRKKEGAVWLGFPLPSARKGRSGEHFIAILMNRLQLDVIQTKHNTTGSCGLGIGIVAD